jgi:hypothetical protein
MRFQLLTLIDITRTNARRGDDPFLQRQQQNYLTALQTISLRANPIVNTGPQVSIQNIKDLGFGKVFKGEHQIWKLNFEFESEGQHSLENLLNDFNFVPIIHGLHETAKFNDAAFITKSDDNRNVIFHKLSDF